MDYACDSDTFAARYPAAHAPVRVWMLRKGTDRAVCHVSADRAASTLHIVFVSGGISVSVTTRFDAAVAAAVAAAAWYGALRERGWTDDLPPVTARVKPDRRKADRSIECVA